MLKTSHVVGFTLATFVAFVIWIVGGWSQGTERLVIGDLVSLVLAVVATVFSVWAARSAHGRLRAAWAALSIGLLGWAIGEAIWAYYELVLHEYPFPSVADAAYLVMSVCACAAMLLFPTTHTARSRARMLFDAVIVAASLFVVFWFSVLQPVFEAGSESNLGRVVSLAYPTLDLVTLTIVAYVAVGAGSYQRLPLTLLALAMTSIALADSAFAFLSATDQYSSGHVIDIGWVAGLLLITVAAAASREGESGRRDSVELPSWASVWVPYAPVMAAGLVAAVQPVEELRSIPMLSAAALLGVAIVARQFLVVSENRRLVASVAEQALRDPLTGLANRDLFQNRLDHAMQFFRRDGFPVGVIAIDLNDFKLVNDTLGHAAGDEVLTLVGTRISGCVRLADTVARLGGNEFAVLVEDEVDYAYLTAQRVVEAFDEPFVIAGRNLLMRPSVGLALAEPDGPDLSAEELFQRATLAMGSAKRSRVAGVTTFTDELDLAEDSGDQALHAPAPVGAASGVEMLRLLGELRYAIDHSELDLAYQPQFDLTTGKIVGVEALLRWPHPTRGVLGPEEFLPLVRRHGLMGAVTAFVLGRALDGAVRWQAVDAGIPVAINFFAPSIVDLRLPDQIAHALAERGLGAAALTVEVTEDLFMTNIGNARAVLNRLRESGTRVSVDDFGSGYSALSYLRDLPIDEVKLDREFVASFLADPRAAAVVSAVVNLARALGLTTVVEGVETAEVAAVLKDLGCDVGQGYYFSPPLTLEELLEVLSAGGTTGSVSAAARSS